MIVGHFLAKGLEPRVKIALVMHTLQVSKERARILLQIKEGFVRELIGPMPKPK